MKGLVSIIIKRKTSWAQLHPIHNPKLERNFSLAYQEGSIAVGEPDTAAKNQTIDFVNIR